MQLGDRAPRRDSVSSTDSWSVVARSASVASRHSTSSLSLCSELRDKHSEAKFDSDGSELSSDLELEQELSEDEIDPDYDEEDEETEAVLCNPEEPDDLEDEEMPPKRRRRFKPVSNTATILISAGVFIVFVGTSVIYESLSAYIRFKNLNIEQHMIYSEDALEDQEVFAGLQSRRLGRLQHLSQCEAHSFELDKYEHEFDDDEEDGYDTDFLAELYLHSPYKSMLQRLQEPEVEAARAPTLERPTPPTLQPPPVPVSWRKRGEQKPLPSVQPQTPVNFSYPKKPCEQPAKKPEFSEIFKSQKPQPCLEQPKQQRQRGPVPPPRDSNAQRQNILQSHKHRLCRQTKQPRFPKFNLRSSRKTQMTRSIISRENYSVAKIYNHQLRRKVNFNVHEVCYTFSNTSKSLGTRTKKQKRSICPTKHHVTSLIKLAEPKCQRLMKKATKRMPCRENKRLDEQIQKIRQSLVQHKRSNRLH